HAPQSGGRAHIDDVVVNQKIAAFHELNAHLLSQERVLEVRRVENSRRQQNDSGLLASRVACRDERSQCRQQGLRVMINWADAVDLEQSRKNALQDFSIGQHVGNTAGNSQVVFEYGKAAVGQSHQVGAANADVNAAR